ncbi:ATP-binding cassette domain-containing protein, partial [Mesomycoplasma neurolyticum]|uniref:Phosphate ABC transporter ATP-binding protein n=1 Tax=Mesomycoplasma neurolyticum TaxID=2120 RepID=A0A449A472_9BACT
MENNKKIVLSVKNLKKYFQNKNSITKAIDGLSFDLYEGEILGLIGESGSGKTTVGRSLIRLIEDKNGQVILNNEIITGKKISRKKDRFLRKNMQMIFQDPHASLNPQKNIYSILKEPLKVNNVIKEKMQDIFSDWENITDNFKYEFIKKYHQIKLDNNNIIIQNAENYFGDWRNTFRKINFNKIYHTTKSYEEVFNSFYLYITQRQFYESNAINQLYKNSSKLLSFYFEKQKDYREKKFSFDEKDLVETKQELLFRRKLLYDTEENYNNKEKLKKLKKLLKEKTEEYKENISNSNKYLKNFIDQFKNEALLNKNQAYSQYDFYVFSNFYKKYLVNKKSKNILSKKYYSKNKEHLLKNLKYLSIENIDDLIKKIQYFNEDTLKLFANKYVKIIDENNLISLSTKDLEAKIIDEYEKLDLSYYFELANNAKKKFEQEIAEIKEEILFVNSKIIKTKSHEKYNLLKYQLADKKYKKAQCVFKSELNKYLVNFNAWLKQIQNLISLKDKEIIKIHEKQKELDRHYREIYQKFLIWLKNKMLDEKHDKNFIKSIINHFKQKNNDKKDNFKRYDEEMVEINKLYYKILFLLRIHNNKLNWNTKKQIKSILYSETIFNILEEVGLLRQFVYRYPHEFSGGQRQRIVIARALISEPKIIIADEPIASLDISIQAQIVNLLKEIVAKKKISMIFIAHDLSMVEYVADKIMIMHFGKVVEQGNVKEIYENPKHPYTINLFKSIPKISNANIPFIASEFQNNYLIEQTQEQNPIITKQVKNSESHFVSGTEKQLKEWLNNEEN